MAKKKSRATLTEPPRMKPQLYLESGSGVKIPKSIKGSKVGKTVTLTVRAKVVAQRLSRHIGRKQTESFDLEISKIKSPGRKKR